MRYIQQGATGFVMGPFVSVADGVSSVSGLVASSLNGFVLNNGITTSYIPSNFTYQANGNYYATTSTIFNSISNDIRVTFSNPLLFAPVWDDFTVLSTNVYTSFFGPFSLVPIPLTDPWVTNLPGPYTGNQAGAIVGAQTQIPIAGIVQTGGTITSCTILVTSGNAPVNAGVLVGRGCLFISGGLIGANPIITSSSIPTTNKVMIVFADQTVAPQAGDLVEIF